MHLDLTTSMSLIPGIPELALRRLPTSAPLLLALRGGAARNLEAGAFGFSVVMGLTGGMLPALQAARMPVLDALRKV